MRTVVRIDLALFKNNKGVSPIEGLIASALLFVGVLGITYIADIISQARYRTKAITSALALESSIVGAITDPSSFGLDYMTQLQTCGTVPTNYRIQVKTPFLTSISSAGQYFYFSPAQNAMGTYVPASGTCQAGYTAGYSDIIIAGRWRLKAGVYRTNAVKPFTFGFAYTIWALKPKKNVPAQYTYVANNYYSYNATTSQYFDLDGSIAPIGARNTTFTAPGVGTTGDYSINLPVSVDVDIINSTSPTKSCDLKTTLGLKGIDPISGNPVCLNRPVSNCPDGTLITSMVSVNNTLVWKCSQPMKKAVCLDPYYQLAYLTPNNLFRHEGVNFNYNAKAGVCVFTGAYSAWSTTTITANGSFMGAVCPIGYKLNTTNACRKQNEVSVSGTCVDYTYTPKKTTYYDPDSKTNKEKTYYEATESYINAPAVPGNIVETQWRDQTTRQWMISCSLNVPAQKCGSRWSAEIFIQPNCVLDTSFFPQTKAAAYAD